MTNSGADQTRRAAVRMLGERTAAIALGASWFGTLVQSRRLLIRGGRVANADGIRGADVLIEGERIVQVAASICGTAK